MQVVRQASGLLGPAGQIGQCEWAERAAQVHGGRQEYMGGREPGAGSARGPAAPPATKACLLGPAAVATIAFVFDENLRLKQGCMAFEGEAGLTAGWPAAV